MNQLGELNWIGAMEPWTLALFIGSIASMLFIFPFFLDARTGEGRVRSAMIERHRARLKNDSMRRGRCSSSEKKTDSRERFLRLVAMLPDQLRSDKQRLLKSAGFSDQKAVIIFWTTKLLFAFIFMIFLFIFLSSHVGDSEGGVWLAAGGASFAAIFAPDFFVKWKRMVRLRCIERALPDALDLLVICAEAGLSLDAALKRVADEFVAVVPELAEELLLTSVELSFLPDRRQALANLAHRADVAAFRGVTATLIQTEKYGTPLVQALRTLAAEFRESRLLQAEEKAARLPAILTVPMIVFILPALFIVLAAPAFIKVAEKIGN